MKVLNEEWRPVIGYEGLYEVSNLGNVRSLYRYKKQLKLLLDKRGYYIVGLYKNKKFNSKSVHRLVAIAFLNNDSNKYAVNHIDGCKLNNNINNLEWVTRNENAKHASLNKLYKGRRGSKCNLAKLTDGQIEKIKLLRTQGYTQAQIAKEFNVHQTNIHYILTKTWRINA